MENEKKTAGERFKNFATESFYFLTSFMFIRNCLGLIVMFAVVFLMSFWWMDCYTRHGKTFEVVDFTGLSLEDAQDLAKSKGFGLVISDSLFLPEQPSNTVISQKPEATSKVKRGRKIYLTVTKAEADKVEIPSLVGGNDDYNTYQKKLKRLKVKTRIKRRQFSNKLAPNTILEVHYKGEEITDKLREGFKVDMGSIVEVVVTDRKGGRVPIPELVCMNYEEAEFLVSNFELNIGSIIEDATVTDKKRAYVWRQIPSPADGQIGIGASVDIYLTQNKPDNCQ